MIRHTLRNKLSSLVLFLLIAGAGLLHSAPVHAVTGSDWNASNIIDDSLFYDNTSMSAVDIQNFLNSKVSSCDTQGTQSAADDGYPSMTHAQYASAKGYPGPPYVCLKDYMQVPNSSQIIDNYSGSTPQGSISAAQIIKNAADTYKVSPKTILVTLQKESLNLIYDTWPLQSQYKNAMGYGCPDTAPCSPSYAGFYNQVNNAAWQFSQYKANPSSYRYVPFQNNPIAYFPNSTTCGSSTVKIQNYATAGLYNYTPYQPDQAALNNLYGSGDSCSSYGNRNFWRIYSDWFGSVRYYFGNIPSYASSYAQSPTSGPSFDSTYVGRLYNPDSRDFLYTTSQNEARLAVSYGYIWDGVVFKNATATDKVPIYRLSNNERHFYTSSSSERDTYIASYGYKDEGVGFYAYATAAADRISVYSTQKSQTVFLTSAAKEAEYYASTYGFSTPQQTFYTEALNSGQTPVYRLSRANNRLYTVSSTEKSYATSLGFTDEGTLNAADTAPAATNSPVYRLRSPSGVYLYTMNRAERDAAVINYGYVSEGIGFYTLLYSNTPIYHSTNYFTRLRLYTNSSLEYTNASKYYGFSSEGLSWYAY